MRVAPPNRLARPAGTIGDRPGTRHLGSISSDREQKSTAATGRHRSPFIPFGPPSYHPDPKNPPKGVQNPF